MRKQKHDNSLNKCKEFLSAFLVSLTKTIQPLKMAMTAEMNLVDNIEGYFMEDDVLELCMIIAEGTTKRTEALIGNMTSENVGLKSKFTLESIERDIARVMTTLQMFARAKKMDYEKNNWGQNQTENTESLFLTIEQLVDSIDYESLTDAIDTLDEILDPSSLKKEDLELIEANN